MHVYITISSQQGHSKRRAQDHCSKENTFCSKRTHSIANTKATARGVRRITAARYR